MLPLKALCLVLAAASQERPKMWVQDLSAQTGLDPSIAAALTDAVAVEVSDRGFFQVVSSHDVQTLLGQERQRQLLGCTDQSSCLTELADAVGARFVMSGAVSKLGDAYQLTLQTLDSQKAAPLGRSVRLAKDLSTLRAQVPLVVAEATATPLPQAPSRALPYSLLAAGSALVLSGGVVGLHAVSQESLIQSEIDQGQLNSAQLKTYAYYTQAQSQYGVERTLSLGAMAVGAGVIAVGLWRLRSGTDGTQLALVPSLGGAALAGTW